MRPCLILNKAGGTILFIGIITEKVMDSIKRDEARIGVRVDTLKCSIMRIRKCKIIMRKSKECGSGRGLDQVQLQDV